MLPEFEIAARFLPILFDTYPREKDEEEEVMRERKSGIKTNGVMIYPALSDITQWTKH